MAQIRRQWCGAVIIGAAMALGVCTGRGAEPKPAETRPGNDAPATRPTGPMYSELLDLLLDPKVDRQLKMQAFELIELTSDRGWSIAPALVRICWSEDPARREMGRWVLWCMLGPDAYHELLDLGEKADIPAIRKVFHGLFVKRNQLSLHPTGYVPGPRAEMTDRPELAPLSPLFFADDWLARRNATEFHIACARSSLSEFRRRGVDYLMEQARAGDVRWQSGIEAIEPLAAVWDADPGKRVEVWALVRKAGPERLNCIPIVLRAWNDPPTELKARVQGLPLFDSDYIVTAVLREPHLSKPAYGLLEAIGERALDRAIGYAAYLAAAGRNDATALLIEWKAENRPVAKLAQAIANLPAGERGTWRSLTDPLLKPELQMVKLLASEPRISTERVAEILRAGKDFFKFDELGHSGWRMVSVLPADMPETREPILSSIKSSDVDYRRAGLKAVARSSSPGMEFKEAAAAHLRDPDDEVRRLSARIVGTEEADRIARTPLVLRDLESSSPETRMSAARRFERLGIEDDRVCRALIRATDARDFAARQGLVAAIGRAYAEQRKTADVLKEMASEDQDPARRAYAKAGLREMQK